MSPGPDEDLILLTQMRQTLNAALRGKQDVIEFVLAGLLARGHLLIEDLPGLGKTTLAKALAEAVGGQFSRVQCTPDLLPGDITGFSVFNQKTREFEFLRGPVFADVLLADEINRTSPRTQSALLEAMAERQVTVDNVRYALHHTFFVLATQNPVEHHGTYPLPEAQLDRFAMKLSVGYPGRDDELVMLASAVQAVHTPAIKEAEGRLRALHGRAERDDRGASVLTPDRLLQLQDRVATIAVGPAVRGYLVDLSTATRNHPRVTLGVSPRGLLTWQRAAQAWAFLQGRLFVTPDDVQAVAEPVLSVRLGVERDTQGAIVNEILTSIKVPVYPREVAG